MQRFHLPLCQSRANTPDREDGIGKTVLSTTPVEAHQHHPSIGTKMSRTRGACRGNLTVKTSHLSHANTSDREDAIRKTVLSTTSVEAHQHHSLVMTTVSRTRGACRGNLTVKTARSP